jgi:hypothetical protein
MIARLAALGCLVLASCSSPGRPSDNPSPTPGEAAPAGDGSHAMKTTPPSAAPGFTPGAPIAPSDQLVAWLDQQQVEVGKPLKVRLPVTLELDPTGTMIGGARVGELPVEINDAALGISLADRVAQHCPDGDTCLLWLQGHWRGGGKFDVTRVDGAIEDAAAASHAEVEAR